MRGIVRNGTLSDMADSPLPMLALVAVSTVVICPEGSGSRPLRSGGNTNAGDCPEWDLVRHGRLPPPHARAGRRLDRCHLPGGFGQPTLKVGGQYQCGGLSGMGPCPTWPPPPSPCSRWSPSRPLSSARRVRAADP